MAANFPASLDTFPDAATLHGHTLDTDPHSVLHENLGDAVTAIEQYLFDNPANAETSILATQIFGGR